jgi:hypothetical protein
LEATEYSRQLHSRREPVSDRPSTNRNHAALLTRISFWFMHPLMPSWDSSRPSPERLTPPKGNSGAVEAKVLIQIVLVSLRNASVLVRSMYFENTTLAGPKMGSVGQFDNLIVSPDEVDLRDRPEEFFEVGRVVTGHVGQDGGLEEIAGTFDRLAAEMQRHAGVNCPLDLLGEARANLGR